MCVTINTINYCIYVQLVSKGFTKIRKVAPILYANFSDPLK